MNGWKKLELCRGPLVMAQSLKCDLNALWRTTASWPGRLFWQMYDCEKTKAGEDIIQSGWERASVEEEVRKFPRLRCSDSSTRQGILILDYARGHIKNTNPPLDLARLLLSLSCSSNILRAQAAHTSYHCHGIRDDARTGWQHKTLRSYLGHLWPAKVSLTILRHQNKSLGYFCQPNLLLEDTAASLQRGKKQRLKIIIILHFIENCVCA